MNLNEKQNSFLMTHLTDGPSVNCRWIRPMSNCFHSDCFFPKLSFVYSICTERYFLVPSIMKLITYSFSILQCNKYDNTTHDICSQTFRKLFSFFNFSQFRYFLFRLQLQIILSLSENPILFKMTKYHHLIWIYSKNLIPC